MWLRTSGASRLNIAKLAGQRDGQRASRTEPRCARAAATIACADRHDAAPAAPAARRPAARCREGQAEQVADLARFGLQRVGEHRRVHDDAVGQHEVLGDAGGDEDRDPERLHRAAPGGERAAVPTVAARTTTKTPGADKNARSPPPPIRSEIAPEGEVADDGKPEREPERRSCAASAAHAAARAGKAGPWESASFNSPQRTAAILAERRSEPS